MIARKEHINWHIARALLLAAVLTASLVYTWSLASGSARAAVPTGMVSQPPQPGNFGQPLENGPRVSPGPSFTAPPSAIQAIDPHWSANVRANIDSSPYAQQEPAVAINPLNHLNIVAAQKDERSAPGPNTATKEVWMDTTTDGGATWINTHIPMPGTNLPQQSDPVVNFSDDNNVFITIIGLSDAGGIGTNTVMVARSTDGGLTWPTPAVALDAGLGGSDKEWTTIDLNPSSPYYHRLYTTWTNFAAGPQFIEKWSSDNGVTWNPPGGTNYVTVSFGSFDGGQFSMPVALPNGNVIATWNVGSQIGVGKSTDGGQSFINPNTSAANITGVNSVPGSQWRLNTIPSTAASRSTGTIVTTWADGRNGKDDIYFVRSTNGGTSWSAAARIPHNPAGGSYQVEPWVSVAPNGRFDVIWYDDRNAGGDPNVFDIYASHSTDDGATWSTDEQVTDATTNLNIGIPHGSGWNAAAGDYINVSSMDDSAFAVWTDTRSGTNEDIYSSRYLPGGAGTATPTGTAGPATNTPTNTSTSTRTTTATTTPVATLTATQPPVTATSTSTVAPATTSTSTPAATNTPGTPTATSTACVMPFVDVQGSDWFYGYVQYLYCHSVVSGYNTNPPCDAGSPCFKPNNSTTRGQEAKIAVLAFNFPINTTGGPHFTDVPVGSTFYPYVETLSNMNIVGGYPDGTYRPNSIVTRGQIAKITVDSAIAADPTHWHLVNPPDNTFEDIPPDSTFYQYVETAGAHNVLAGYPCGSPPAGGCVPPANKPYFLPNNNATRAQISKITYLAVTGTP